MYRNVNTEESMRGDIIENRVYSNGTPGMRSSAAPCGWMFGNGHRVTYAKKNLLLLLQHYILAKTVIFDST